MSEKKLYLIDGYAFAYRAYFAHKNNPLVNSQGFPTSAIFGFANYILRLNEIYNCPYLAVVMDSGAPTFRHAAYEQYKANRAAMPDDLKMQIPRLFDLLDAFNIPVISREGFEADDVIATLAKRAAAQNFHVYLVTKDKDLMQLIDNDVTMLAPDGFGSFVEMREEDVFNKLGVPPARVLDYLSMVGDASDNIPGVAGIGPKTAAKILETHTVDEILNDPSTLKNQKLVDKFTEHKDNLALSKMLATLRFDVELDFDIDTLKRRGVDAHKCQAILKEFEFHSMLKNPIFGAAASGKFEPALHTVDDIKKLREIVNKINEKKSCAINITADAPLARAANITGITLAVDANAAYHIKLADDNFGDNKSEYDELLGLFDSANTSVINNDNDANDFSSDTIYKMLNDVFESDNIKKIGHDFKRMTQLLRGVSITLRGIRSDTMIAAYVVDPGKRKGELRDLASDYLSIDINAQCAAQTVCATLPLAEKLEAVIAERDCYELYNGIELPLIPVLADLEWHGVMIDTKLLADLTREYTANINALTKEIYELANGEFNINSPKQTADVLFNKLGLHSGKKTKSGAFSTNAETLEKLAPDHLVVQKILDYREKQKLLSTYIDALPAQILPRTNRVHTSFNQTITATGRLSSTNPNLQNIPIRTESGKKIRGAFIAPENFAVVSADYSQIELRVLAHLSNDPVLIAAFNNDMDIHTQTAAAVYDVTPDAVSADMRRAAKTINFGLMYGMGPVNLSKQLGVSFYEAKRFIDSYFDQFPSIQNYLHKSVESARELGYSETLLGRRRYLPELNSANRVVKEAAERVAVNTPVQGGAADIIKLAMIRAHAKLEREWPNTKMLLQVHDELVFETPLADAENFSRWISDEMSGAYKLIVPLKVDASFGRHWGEAH